MVYGNTGDDSGSGVAFTRNPATGENVFYGEFLINAQGEDVVAGVRTPEPVLPAQGPAARSLRRAHGGPPRSLEKHFKDMQDFEFTIQDGKLYMLQTRNGKRTGVAALKFVDRHGEGEADRLEDGHHPQSRPTSSTSCWPRSSTSAEVKKRQGDRDGPARRPRRGHRQDLLQRRPGRRGAEKGEKVLLVRIETSPEDLRGMIAAEGILTARGGVSSHAALVARQMGKVCVCGAAALHIDYDTKTSPSAARSSTRATSSPSTAPRRRLRRRAQDRPLRDDPGAGPRRQGRPRDRKVQELQPAHEVVPTGHAS